MPLQHAHRGAHLQRQGVDVSACEQFLRGVGVPEAVETACASHGYSYQKALLTVECSRPRIDADLHVILVLLPDCSDA